MDDGNTTMTCICGTTHHFAPGVGVGTCAGCGLGLLLTEEVTVLDTEAARERVRAEVSSMQNVLAAFEEL